MPCPAGGLDSLMMREGISRGIGGGKHLDIETLEQAAVREVKEETGIDIEIECFVEIIEAITPGDAGFHFVIMDYVAREVGGSLAAGSDALDAIWACAEELPGLNLTKDLETVIQKARQITNRSA